MGGEGRWGERGGRGSGLSEDRGRGREEVVWR